MSKFLRPDYENIEPYTPGEQINDKSYIKLNTNESPFPPSPKVMEAITRDRIDKLNLYSDPELKVLIKAIANRFNVQENQVFAGNGSDDVLAFAIMAFCGNGGELVCPDITYGFYPVFADLFNVKLIEKPLTADFKVDINDYIGINKNIVIANPNAPTGLALSVNEIEQIVKSNPDNIVIIDEAYMDFCRESCYPLLDKYNNLIVVQTFSKSRNLAGLRVGFALSSKEIIEDYNKMKFSFNPYNLNTLSIHCAAAAIEDRDYYTACCDKIIKTREYTKKELEKTGFICLDSRANFVFAKHKKISGEKLYLALKDKGVLIRYFAKPRISNFVRITIGAQSDMEKVISIIREITEKENKNENC